MTGAEAREKRLSLGLSQIDIAIEIGISDVSLRYFEKGSRKLTKEHEEKLIEFFKNKKV